MALAPLGDGAAGALHVVVLGSFAALGGACVALGRELVSWPVGILFAAIVLTREPLVAAMLDTSFDVPFLALVVLAAWLAARGAPPAAVAAPLVVAGLLRPEAWLVLAAYGAYAVWRGGGSPWRWALAVAGAPAAWAAADVVLAGDALHSLRHTRELASELERPRSVGSAPELLGDYLVAILGEPAAWGGAVAAIAAVWLLPGRLRVPLALLGLGVAGFLALGVAGLPLLTRYALVPASMLALLCAVGAVGARAIEDRRVRRAWALAGVALGIALVAFAPSDADRVRAAADSAERRRALQADVEAIARDPALARCDALALPGPRPLPLLARTLAGGPEPQVGAGAARRGTAVLAPVTAEAAAYATLRPERPLPPPRPGRALARNASWLVLGSCA